MKMINEKKTIILSINCSPCDFCEISNLKWYDTKKKRILEILFLFFR